MSPHLTSLLLQSAFQNAPIGTVLVGSDGSILGVNSAMLAMLGYTDADIGRYGLNDVMHPEDVAAAQSSADALRAGAPQRYEAERRFIHRDGHVIPALLTVTAVPDQAGMPPHIIVQVQDITERKRADDRLHFQSVLLDNMAEGVVVSDESDIIRYTNRAQERMLGYGPGELVGKHVLWVTPDSVEDKRETLATVKGEIEQHGMFCGEIATCRRDGTAIVLGCRINAMEFAGRRYRLGLHRDITEQMRADAALRESEDLFHSAFEHASMGISLVAPGQAIVRVNQALCALLGYSKEELLGLRYRDLIHPDDLAAAQADSRRIAAGEIERYQAERRYRHKSGRILYAQSAVSVVRDRVGSVRYFVTQLEDVTERRLAQDQLRKAHDELESRVTGLLDSMTSGFFITRPDWTIAYMNRGAEVLLRRDRNTTIGRNVWEVFPEARGTPIEELYLRALSEHVPADLENYFAPLSSWFRMHVYPTAEGICTLFEDINEQRASDVGAVSDILRALNAETDVRMAFPAVFTGLQHLAGCDFAGIGAITDGGLRVLALEPRDTAFEPNRLWPLAQLGPAVEVLSGAVHLAPDLSAELHSEASRSAYQAGYRSSITLPLRTGERITGMLNLMWVRVAGFDTSKIPVLHHLASALGLAIERSRLFEEVKIGRERLQALSLRIMEVQESERRHLARELHDEIGQYLTGLRFLLDAAGRKPMAALRNELVDARRMIDDLVVRIRNLSLDLRPAILDDFGLVPALIWLFDRYTALTAVRVHFTHQGMDARLPREIETAAYRIVQEALTNVARYAQVKEVAVRVAKEDGELALFVADEGVGFDLVKASSSRQGSGLAGMRERVELLGGRLTVTSAPGAGTRLRAALPCANVADLVA
ncbi:MAG: sensory box sensor histidine kinase [Deltaproteobacteria bacterium]|nr:sensory box sensor histidine kinase [Deltaproteobacteria bacterium]